MNVFNINKLNPSIANAKDKALAIIGELGLNNLLDGRVLPVLPPYPANNKIDVTQAADFGLGDTVNYNTTQAFSIFGTPMVFPLSIKKSSSPDSDWWLLPTEPILTIGGGHTLTRRNVAKSKYRGSVKERWNEDDYSINIDLLLTKVDDWSFPKEDFLKLREILEYKGPVDVQCEILELLGIGRIAIEKFDYPFTKGEENQRVTITAYSDDDWDLFIKLNTD